MGTPAIIAQQTKQNEYRVIYCHYDGYVDGCGVGATLDAHYGDPAKVDELMDLGDLSSLRARVAPDAGEVHSWRDPVKDVTVAYHRDRGEARGFTMARNIAAGHPRDLLGDVSYVYVYGLDDVWRVVTGESRDRLRKLSYAVRDAERAVA